MGVTRVSWRAPGARPAGASSKILLAKPPDKLDEEAGKQNNQAENAKLDGRQVKVGSPKSAKLDGQKVKINHALEDANTRFA